MRRLKRTWSGSTFPQPIRMKIQVALKLVLFSRHHTTCLRGVGEWGLGVSWEESCIWREWIGGVPRSWLSDATTLYWGKWRGWKGHSRWFPWDTDRVTTIQKQQNIKNVIHLVTLGSWQEFALEFVHHPLSFTLPSPLFSLIALPKASLNKYLLNKYCIQITGQDSKMQLLSARSFPAKIWLSPSSRISPKPGAFLAKGRCARLVEHC